MAPKTVTMTVTGGAAPPSLEEAAAQLGVGASALNASFGVIPIDPGQHLYAVEVDADALPAGEADKRPFRGPYANPRIDAFGPSPDESKD